MPAVAASPASPAWVFAGPRFCLHAARRLAHRRQLVRSAWIAALCFVLSAPAAPALAAHQWCTSC
jgi:hypothetical protein